MSTTQIPFPAVDSMEELVERFADYNEKTLATARKLSGAYLDTYEKVATGFAAFEEQVGTASQNEWISAVTSAHAGLTREFAHATTSAARELLR